jgi:hypothetical protein
MIVGSSIGFKCDEIQNEKEDEITWMTMNLY